MTSYPPRQLGDQPPGPGSWASSARTQQAGAPAGGYATPPPAASDVRASPVGWLVPIGALLAVIGAATPWFKPSANLGSNGLHRTISFSNLYSWKDGKVGLIAPLVLVGLSIAVIALMRGKVMSRFTRGSRHPVASAGISVIIAGAIALVSVLIAWFLLPGQLIVKTPGGDYKGWSQIKDAAHAAGDSSVSLSHGTGIGYWLTLTGGVLAVVAGLLLLLEGRRQQHATPRAGPQGGYAAPGYAAPGYDSVPGYRPTTPDYSAVLDNDGPGYPAPDATTTGAQPPPPPTYP